jgi:hypothetical protein
MMTNKEFFTKILTDTMDDVSLLNNVMVILGKTNSDNLKPLAELCEVLHNALLWKEQNLQMQIKEMNKTGEK